MKHFISTLALLLMGWDCQAAIGTGFGAITGAPQNYANGKPVLNNAELYLAVFDPEAKVSYILDLGLDMETFFINAQQDAGMQWFKPLDDANWGSFLEQVNRSKLRWVVLSNDDYGGIAVGQKRMFMTLTQGTEAKLRTWNNQQFTMASGDGRKFLDFVQQQGTHLAPMDDLTVNGSSVATPLNPGVYFGPGAQATLAKWDETLNGRATGFTAGNAIGQSSWFYYVTRSGTSQSASVLVDEFDNLGGDAYWGFTYVDPATDANSPYAGKFLLSYTLEKAGATASTAEGLQRISMTDYLALNRLAPPRYFAASSTLAAEYAGYRQGSLVVVAGSMVSAVPEPASWGLMGLGLGLLAAWRRRAARQH